MYMEFPRPLAWFFLALGLLMFTGAVITGLKAWESGRGLERANGTVIRLRDAPGTAYNADVRFSTPDGREREFTVGLSSRSFLEGEAVKVLYYRDQPEQASIEGRNSRWESPGLFLMWAVIFGSVWAIPTMLKLFRRRRNDWLKMNGRRLEAAYTGIRINRNFAVNDKNPYRITARWIDPATNEPLEFQSVNLWRDPGDYCQSLKFVEIMIDPQKPKRYWMNLDFLPKD